MKKYALAAIFAFCTAHLLAQPACPQLLKGSQLRLKNDISYLASDELEGRAPGTKGIELAAIHIVKAYKQMGLEPYTDEGFRQEFSIPVEVEFGEGTALLIDGSHALREDFYPTSHSGNGTAEGLTVYVKYGMVAPEKKYDDYKKMKPEKLKGKVFVMDVSSPDGIHPHSEYLKYHDLGERIALAKEKGAAAVLLVNLQGSANDISPDFRNIHSKGLPVVFVTNNEVAKKLKKETSVTLATALRPKNVQAFNLVGYQNNSARQTVVIGAHYDHLGMGGRSSLAADKEPVVHNGADDNASGVAAMLEIARNLTGGNAEFKKYNYLFMAFSGEEMGLLGSADFTANLSDENKSIKFMLNLDMVGRLEEGLLAVNGVGTSPQWRPIVNEVKCGELKIKTSESGVGPSDHTNFYYKDIPVLHFFTGTHTDYHKPTDDVEKINFEGTEKVIEYILGVILFSQEYEQMEFAPTSEASQMVPKFTVTLGVMPDYMYSGEGMRIDGVTEGRPADKAGLLAGDVVVKLGDVKVVDMMSYMKALGQYKKGDEAEIEYMRDGQKMKGKVKF